ncbi:hypothetical protein THAOC_37617 [Thalassiosira oceanica]|uniref:Uncharacterized protein n=1 Tax=Thalassiosira oceanica TaxID=159749 RepID=K0QZT3_THAOC|nr:hypothetical protein THAOC_37617 [Thalassiosira oceanica]|eukprot:EJK43894.1 hypothetical protein THAOC_37617 [Thalassiosira oceanica]
MASHTHSRFSLGNRVFPGCKQEAEEESEEEQEEATKSRGRRRGIELRERLAQPFETEAEIHPTRQQQEPRPTLSSPGEGGDGRADIAAPLARGALVLESSRRQLSSSAALDQSSPSPGRGTASSSSHPAPPPG